MGSPSAARVVDDGQAGGSTRSGLEGGDRGASPEPGRIVTAPHASEGDLVGMLLEAAPYALTHVRIFRRPVFNVQAVQGFRARAGIPGQADLYAVVKGSARHIELEAKLATGRMAVAQKSWRAFCLEWSIPHLVLRAQPGEAPGDTVQRWVREIWAAAQ